MSALPTKSTDQVFHPWSPHKLGLALVFSVLVLPVVTAQTAQLVHDVNTAIAPAPSGDPDDLAVVGSRMFFAATSKLEGRELWMTDATTAGTVLVKNIVPGIGSSNPTGLTAYGSHVYFAATDSAADTELWKSDGSSAGTMRVTNLSPTQSSSPRELTVVGGWLYFAATDGSSGLELFKTDGSATGTSLVKDINPGFAGSQPTSLVEFGGKLYFVANDGMNGMALWCSDGSAAGTTWIKQIDTGGGGLPPLPLGGRSGPLPGPVTQLVESGARLFFVGSDSTHGSELWASDGTALGTSLVKDIITGANGSMIASLTDVAGTLFFTANDGTNGCELWKSDGSAGNTNMVLAISPSTSAFGCTDAPNHLTAVGSVLYFAADDGLHGWELWKSNGSKTGTMLVRDITTGWGGGAGDILDATAKWMSFGGALYFQAHASATGVELWRSSAAGTTLVKDIRPGTGSARPRALTAFSPNVFLFSADDGTAGEERELWKSDGSVEGTVLVKDTYVNDHTMSSVAAAFAAGPNGRTIFAAYDPIHGDELWATESNGQTHLVMDIRPGLVGSMTGNREVPSSYFNTPKPPVLFDGYVYFTANDGVHGFEVWKTDGTSAGTSMLKDILSGAGTGGWGKFVVAGARLYFVANDGTHGPEIWKTDGTRTGTSMVKDVSLSSYGGPFGLVALGTSVYFAADSDGTGIQLWKTDGSASGTVMVKEINPNGSAIGMSPTSGDTTPVGTIVGSHLYFAANDGVNGIELWRSGGDAASTFLVKDIVPGAAGSYPHSMAALGSELFFNASDKLWKSAGTSGTTLEVVADAGGSVPPPIPGFPLPGRRSLLSASDLTVVGSTLYLIARSGNWGLWKTDGTPTGTSLVAPTGFTFVNEGLSGHGMKSLGSKLYFAAKTQATGKELWVSDGTAAGTQLHTDFWPGLVGAQKGSGWPQHLTVSHGALYLSADDGVHGREPWVVQSTSTPEVDPAISEVSAESTLISSCGSTLIQVTPRLTNGTPMGAGQSVSFTTTAGALSIVTYEADVYSVELSGTSATALAVVTAKVNGKDMLTKPAITFVPISTSLSLVQSDVPSTFKDGIVTVTVKPKDCLGAPVDGSWQVALSTDGLTALVGNMTYMGNGCYQQKVSTQAVGTSKISATVAGLALDDDASIAILDPGNLGKVIGLEADTTIHSYSSVQDAVNHVRKDSLVRILVSPGTYDEKVECEHGNVSIEGLSATHPVILRRLEIEECSNVQLKYLTFDPGNKGDEILEIEEASNISVICCTITGAKKEKEGVEIEKSTGVSFYDCYIHSNGGDGIEIKHGSSVLIQDCLIENNALNGIKIDKKANAVIRTSTIRKNGTAGKDRKGYGIYLRRHVSNDPTSVTLSGNTLSGNRGRLILNKSTAELANYDQILDTTDAQTTY